MKEKLIFRLQRLFYWIKRDYRFRYFDWFINNLSMDQASLLNMQNDLIQNIVNYAYNHTDYYKQLFDKFKIHPEVIKNREDLKRISTLTKEDLSTYCESIKSDDKYGKKLVRITSGGSTGNQSVVYKSKYYIEMSYAASMRNNTIANWWPYDKVLFLWGSPIEFQNLQKSFLLRLSFKINRRYLLNAYNYGHQDFRDWAKLISRKKIKVIYGYATMLKDFANYIIKNKIKISGIRSVVSTTEKLTNRNIIEQAFNCKVFDQYGCREVLGVSIEDDSGNMLIADDNVVLNMGEDGKILITALHSYGFPLLNYEVGDIGLIASDEMNNTTLPFTSMRLTVGRETDNFITEKNKVISSSSISTALSLFNIKVIEQQVIQRGYRDFLVLYIPRTDFLYSYYQEILYKVFRKLFGSEIKIEFQQVDKIPLEKSGKKLMFKREFEK